MPCLSGLHPKPPPGVVVLPGRTPSVAVLGVNRIGRAIAAEEADEGIGRIRMARVRDASADSLHAFIRSAVMVGSVVHTDAWEGYTGLAQEDYEHQITYLRGQGKKAASELPPRVHRVASLLKRWLLGTHQGAVRPDHLDFYLDEFTFRFNRRTSRSRGKLFYRLLQQVVQIEPCPYKEMVGGRPVPPHPQPLGSTGVN